MEIEIIMGLFDQVLQAKQIDGLFTTPGSGADWRERHVMVDLETTDTKPTAGTLSIGACHFDPFRLQSHEELKAHSFYCNIDPQTFAPYKRTTSPETMQWWREQNTAAWEALQDNQIPLQHAVFSFMAWLNSHPLKMAMAWANSPSFDYVILEDTFRACRQIWPIRHWQQRDVRTIDWVCWPEGGRPQVTGTAHNAADDSIAQAHRVQVGYQVLGYGDPKWKEPAMDIALGAPVENVLGRLFG